MLVSVSFRSSLISYTKLIENGKLMIKVSVSFRSSLISYTNDNQQSSDSAGNAEFPSPFGVLSFLIVIGIDYVQNPANWKFPSPFGVLSFLMDDIEPTVMHTKYKGFRLLSEFSHFLCDNNEHGNRYHYHKFPSPFGVLSFLILARFVKHNEDISSFRLLSEFSHFL